MKKLLLFVLLIVGCEGPEPIVESIAFAVIGDYGYVNNESLQVAELVKSWNPDFIITLGDNAYTGGGEDRGDNYEEIVSALYGSYIENQNFWPSLGNHDFVDHGGDASEYLEYFSYLPGKQRYYEKQIGLVHLFNIDSYSYFWSLDSSDEIQKDWLKQALLTSDAPYKFVYFHHPPFTVGSSAAMRKMRWDFTDWGATAVLAGHDHSYQRYNINGIPYIVNGMGGAHITSYDSSKNLSNGHIPISTYYSKHGAMRVIINSSSVNYEFINIDGEIIDNYKWKLN